MSNEARIVVMVDEKTKRQFTRAVKANGTSLAFVLRELIADWSAKNRSGPGRRPRKVGL